MRLLVFLFSFTLLASQAWGRPPDRRPRTATRQLPPNQSPAAGLKSIAVRKTPPRISPRVAALLDEVRSYLPRGTELKLIPKKIRALEDALERVFDFELESTFPPLRVGAPGPNIQLQQMQQAANARWRQMQAMGWQAKQGVAVASRLPPLGPGELGDFAGAMSPRARAQEAVLRAMLQKGVITKAAYQNALLKLMAGPRG